jgi:Raf kinase inhibitor-like YbhB/YbcL family protein
MGILGALLKNRKAGETHLAWNLPTLSGPQTLTLTSEAFRDGETIPAEHAGKRAGGRNASPPLAWSEAPSGTASLLLVVEDVDAPTPKPFVHCVALIDPSVRQLPADGLSGQGSADGVRLLRSGMGRGYLGPEPIKGHGPHRYVFQLFALTDAAVPEAGQAAGSRPRTLLASIPGPVLARGRLTGIFER